jgi:hypothetical protein
LRFDSKSPNLTARGIRLLALAALVLVAAACSTIKVGYNNADRLLLYSLDRYVDLTNEQEDGVRRRMNSVMAWHRSTQLSDYAAFVQSTRSLLGGSITAVEVLEFNAGLNARLSALGERIAPDFAALALTFTPDQLDQLERKLVDENRKVRRESAQEMKQALDARARKYAERAEFWFGKLNAQQVEVIRRSLAERPVDSLYWIEARERRSANLVALLRRIHAEQPTEETATSWIQSYFAALARPSDPGQRERAETFRRENAVLIAQLVNSATPQQRAHLDRRLSGFASEFVQLAQRGGSGLAA